MPIATDTAGINLHPKVPYINVTIGLPENKGPQYDKIGIQAKVLLDSGAAKTTMHQNFYLRLMSAFNNTKNSLTVTKDYGIKTIIGTTTPISGMTKFRLWISTKPPIYRDGTAMVIENLAHDFILGNDMIGCKKIVKAFTPETLIMAHPVNGSNVYLDIEQKVLQLIPCWSFSTTKIEPRQETNVTHKYKEPLPKGTKFTVANSKINHLEAKPTIFESDGISSLINIPVRNNSDKNLTIKRRMKLFNLQIVGKENPFNGPHSKKKLDSKSDNDRIIKDHSRDTIELANKKTIKWEGPEKDIFQHIHTDRYLSKKEIELEKELFKERGYIQPSITQYIKDKSSVTEIELVQENEVTKDNFLTLFDIKHLSKQSQAKANSIFLKHSDAFSLHKYDIGCTDLIEMPVKLNSNLPKMQKYIPIPHNMREKTKEILDQMLKHGIIRECPESSQYCSNILVIKKKDKDSIRLLFDGRLLNYDTIREPMAMISKPEILAHLVNKTHLTSLDFSDAFFHIPLSKEAQPLTAFYSHTHGLRMCFTRCPQGLKNSPLYLKLLLDKIFKDMTDTVLFYADDLLIATNGSIGQHLKIVEKVLERIKDANLKLRPQKLLLAKEHIEFLGMIFKKGTISIPDMKLEAFKRMESPTTPKKAKSLICCLSYYRNFCPKFAELSHDINQATLLHSKQFKWTPVLESKLRLLIDTICNNASLSLPNPAKTFYVQTDASKYCGAGRIFQKDESGNENVIAAVSRTFTKTERGYAIFKQEILALLYTLKSMDYFLRYAKKLVILVDAKSIIYLRLAKEASGILLRFSLELSRYNAEIYHIPGEENVISDVLSRQHAQIEQLKQDDISNATLSEKDTMKLVKRLTLPKDFTLTQNELSLILEGNSPPTIKKTTTKKSKAVTGKRHIKNVPTTLGEKKPNLPRTTNYRPGMNHCIPCNMITRSMTKQKATEMNQESQNENLIVPIQQPHSKRKKNRATKKVSFKNPIVEQVLNPNTTDVTIDENLNGTKRNPENKKIQNEKNIDIETINKLPTEKVTIQRKVMKNVTTSKNVTDTEIVKKNDTNPEKVTQKVTKPEKVTKKVTKPEKVMKKVTITENVTETELVDKKSIETENSHKKSHKTRKSHDFSH